MFENDVCVNKVDLLTQTMCKRLALEHLQMLAGFEPAFGRWQHHDPTNWARAHFSFAFLFAFFFLPTPTLHFYPSTVAHSTPNKNKTECNTTTSPAPLNHPITTCEASRHPESIIQVFRAKMETNKNRPRPHVNILDKHQKMFVFTNIHPLGTDFLNMPVLLFKKHVWINKNFFFDSKCLKHKKTKIP